MTKLLIHVDFHCHPQDRVGDPLLLLLKLFFQHLLAVGNSGHVSIDIIGLFYSHIKLSKIPARLISYVLFGMDNIWTKIGKIVNTFLRYCR